MVSAPPPGRATLECASFRAVLIGRIIGIRWHGQSEPQELAALTAFILKAQQTTGDKVDFFAVVPVLEIAPPSHVREALVAFANDTRDAIAATDVVLGKGGFWQTIVRSIITSLITIARGHRNTVVHSTPHDALAAACARRGLAHETLRAALVEYGILSGGGDATGT